MTLEELEEPRKDWTFETGLVNSKPRSDLTAPALYLVLTSDLQPSTPSHTSQADKTHPSSEGER